MEQKNAKTIYQTDFIKPIIRWGSATNILACILAFVPAVYLWLAWDALPPLSAVIQGAAATILGFSAVFWVVEPISYFPILGIPGTYMNGTPWLNSWPIWRKGRILPISLRFRDITPSAPWPWVLKTVFQRPLKWKP